MIRTLGGATPPIPPQVSPLNICQVKLYIADTLSRASQTSMPECMDIKDEFEVYLLVPISKEKAEEFKRELDPDPIMAKLKETVLLG